MCNITPKYQTNQFSQSDEIFAQPPPAPDGDAWQYPPAKI